MRHRQPRYQWVYASDEFLVSEHVVLHVRMFSSYWAVRNRRCGTLVDLPGRAGHNGTVDDGQLWPVLSNVTAHRRHEVWNLVRKADMHYRAWLDNVNWLNVYTFADEPTTED